MPSTKIASTVERVVNDIRSGENIDIYASVFAAFAIIFLNQFGVISDDYYFPVSLALLAIVAYSIVSLKRDVSDFKYRASGSVPRHEFISNFPAEFQSQLDAAHEVWFSGTHLNSAITAYHDIIVKKLKRGGVVRFLLVCPDGAAAVLAAKRFPGSVSLDQEAARIRTSLQQLSRLMQEFPNKVQIRTIDFPIEYTTFFINPEDTAAVIYVERATYKISGGIHKPKFVFCREDGRWFNHVESEVRLLWSDATPLVPAGEKSSKGASNIGSKPECQSSLPRKNKTSKIRQTRTPTIPAGNPLDDTKR